MSDVIEMLPCATSTSLAEMRDDLDAFQASIARVCFLELFAAIDKGKAKAKGEKSE